MTYTISQIAIGKYIVTMSDGRQFRLNAPADKVDEAARKAAETLQKERAA